MISNIIIVILAITVIWQATKIEELEKTVVRAHLIMVAHGIIDRVRLLEPVENMSKTIEKVYRNE